MLIGFGKRDITPENGTLMAGHPGEKRSEGVRDGLYARAMALCAGTETYLFVSADVLFVEYPSVCAIRKAVSKETGIPERNMFIASTHTHSGPLTSGLYGSTAESGYLERLHFGATEAAVAAVSDMREAALSYGACTAEGFAFCARVIKSDGSVETHPWKDDCGKIDFEGVPDESFTLLSATDENGELLGGIINYANHPQVMPRESALVSADFPGAMERFINKRWPRAVVLFMNGACGDICPVNAMEQGSRGLGPDWVEFMGGSLARTAIELPTEPVGAGGLAYAERALTLRIRELSEEKLAAARKYVPKEEAAPGLMVSNYGVEGKDSREYISLEDYLHTDEWLEQEYKDLLALEKRKARQAEDEVKLCALRIGDAAILMLPFEVFTSIGRKIKERSPFAKTVVLELTNGAFGYLPDREAFVRPGGYETLTLTSSCYEPDSDEKVIECALAALEALHKKS